VAFAGSFESSPFLMSLSESFSTSCTDNAHYTRWCMLNKVSSGQLIGGYGMSSIETSTRYIGLIIIILSFRERTNPYTRSIN
jgi:hypothetical protein